MAWCRPGSSHYLNQTWLFYRRIYASLGLNELLNGAPGFPITEQMNNLARRNDSIKIQYADLKINVPMLIFNFFIPKEFKNLVWLSTVIIGNQNVNCDKITLYMQNQS